jgi:thymidylate kinase
MPELSVSPTLDLTRNDRGPEPRTSGAPPAPGRFICFEGIDGAGKTTIAKAVAERLLAAGRPVLYLEKKCPRFPSSFLQHHMQIVGTALWHSPKGSPIGTLGDDHWLHLMVSWFAALDHSCVRPALANGRFIVTDNWYYKFIARFAAKPSYTLGDLEHCFARISVPTDVIMLDVAPEVAAGRRPEFSQTEHGRLDGGTQGDPGEFIRYQGRIRDILRSFGTAHHWHFIDSTRLTAEAVTHAATSTILASA